MRRAKKIPEIKQKNGYLHTESKARWKSLAIKKSVNKKCFARLFQRAFYHFSVRPKMCMHTSHPTLKITTNRPAGIENIPKLYLFDNLIGEVDFRQSHTVNHHWSSFANSIIALLNVEPIVCRYTHKIKHMNMTDRRHLIQISINKREGIKYIPY